jgi:hypothetical protein
MLVNEEEVKESDPTLGWSDLILGGIDVRKIPGDHEAYIRQYVQTAAKELRECIESASITKSNGKQRLTVSNVYGTRNDRSANIAIGRWGKQVGSSKLACPFSDTKS